MRQINAIMFEGIKRFEGLRLKSYKCPADVLTIGYGHTGQDVFPEQVITKKTAEKLLDKDLDYFEATVEKMITVSMNDNEFSAFVSLAYNIGTGSPKSERRIGFYWSSARRLFLEGKKELAAAAFMRYNKAKVNGKYQVLPGLNARREFEKTLFLTPDEQTGDKIIPLINLIKELSPLEAYPFKLHKQGIDIQSINIPQFSPFKGF
jgi:lysozyme